MKKYISANDYLHDSWRLAESIYRSGWRPDLLVSLWRGGAPVGMAVHEYLRIRGWDIKHIVASPPPTISSNYSLQLFPPTQHILFLDDVFDTGKTWETILNHLSPTPTIPSNSYRLATVYWKKPCNLTNLKPDWTVREVGEEWLVFPHELDGLSPEELAVKDSMLHEIMNML